MQNRLPMAAANILLVLVFGRDQTTVGPIKPLFLKLTKNKSTQFFPARHTCCGGKTRGFTSAIKTPFSTSNRSGAIKIPSQNMRIASAGFFFPQ